MNVNKKKKKSKKVDITSMFALINFTKEPRNISIKISFDFYLDGCAPL